MVRGSVAQGHAEGNRRRLVGFGFLPKDPATHEILAQSEGVVRRGELVELPRLVESPEADRERTRHLAVVTAGLSFRTGRPRPPIMDEPGRRGRRVEAPSGVYSTQSSSSMGIATAAAERFDAENVP